MMLVKDRISHDYRQKTEKRIDSFLQRVYLKFIAVISILSLRNR